MGHSVMSKGPAFTGLAFWWCTEGARVSYSEWIQQRVVVEGHGGLGGEGCSREQEAFRLTIRFSEGVTHGQIQGKGVL